MNVFDILQSPGARALTNVIGAPETKGWRTGKRTHYFKLWTPKDGWIDKLVQLTGRKHHARANWSHYRKNGSLLMAGANLPNIWTDEGEEYLVKVAFSEELAVPANHYIGLGANALAETDVLATITGEPAVGGYARQAVPTDGTGYTTSFTGGNWQAKTTTEAFTPSGADYPAVTQSFLTDQATGTVGDLYCEIALSASRTVLDGDTLNVDMTIAISE